MLKYGEIDENGKITIYDHDYTTTAGKIQAQVLWASKVIRKSDGNQNRGA